MKIQSFAVLGAAAASSGCGSAVPPSERYSKYTFHIIKALEEKNDGKFDYSGEKEELTWSK